jgi:hypothetical protein
MPVEGAQLWFVVDQHTGKELHATNGSKYAMEKYAEGFNKAMAQVSQAFHQVASEIEELTEDAREKRDDYLGGLDSLAERLRQIAS